MYFAVNFQRNSFKVYYFLGNDALSGKILLHVCCSLSHVEYPPRRSISRLSTVKLAKLEQQSINAQARSSRETKTWVKKILFSLLDTFLSHVELPRAAAVVLITLHIVLICIYQLSTGSSRQRASVYFSCVYALVARHLN